MPTISISAIFTQVSKIEYVARFILVHSHLPHHKYCKLSRHLFHLALAEIF